VSYCLLRQDARFDYWMALRIYGVEPEDLIRGQPLEDVPPVRVSISAQSEGFSDLLELPCLVVSEALRKVLERLGIDNIQYFPAELQIEYMDEPLDGYWLANVIGLVSCVDRDRSHFEPRFGSATGELRGFEVDPAQSYGLRLFRLAEDPRLVVVSDQVRAAVAATTLRGVLLQETRNYDGYPASTEPDEDD
jgi:hypothetical protein